MVQNIPAVHRRQTVGFKLQFEFIFRVTGENMKVKNSWKQHKPRPGFQSELKTKLKMKMRLTIRLNFLSGLWK